MDFSDRFRQYEQALRDPATRHDPDKLARAVTEVHSLLEALHDDIAKLDKERESLIAARQSFQPESDCDSTPNSGGLVPANALNEESFLGLFLRLYGDQVVGIAGSVTEPVTGPRRFQDGIEGVKPITRCLTEVAGRCLALGQLPLADESFVAELERTLELDQQVRQRILNRTEGAL